MIAARSSSHNADLMRKQPQRPLDLGLLNYGSEIFSRGSWQKDLAWLAATHAFEFGEGRSHPGRNRLGHSFYTRAVMSTLGAHPPLVYERLDRANLGAITAIELDPDHVERFLGPLEDIATAVRNGPAHAMFAIKVDSGVIGFYVLHPDGRNAACWWLGWFALDRRKQGLGLGRATMAHILSSLRRIAGCRRVRLLVAPDKVHAMRLYTQASFQRVGISGSGELILETKLPASLAAETVRITMLPVVVTPGASYHVGRLRLSAGPYAARMIGVSRGPPCQYPCQCEVCAGAAKPGLAVPLRSRSRDMPVAIPKSGTSRFYRPTRKAVLSSQLHPALASICSMFTTSCYPAHASA